MCIAYTCAAPNGTRIFSIKTISLCKIIIMDWKSAYKYAKASGYWNRAMAGDELGFYCFCEHFREIPNAIPMGSLNFYINNGVLGNWGFRVRHALLD